MVRQQLLMVCTLVVLLPTGVSAGPHSNLRKKPGRIQHLSDFLKKEKKNFHQRESKKKGLINALDKLNANQNALREEISQIKLAHQELVLALENLSFEYKKGKSQELIEKKRVRGLIQRLYQIHKAGIVGFVLEGDSFSSTSSRLQILFRALRSRSHLVKRLKERTERLRASEEKLREARGTTQGLLEQSHAIGKLLSNLLKKKNRLLRKINQQQTNYRMLKKEYTRASNKLNTIFNQVDTKKSRRTLFFEEGPLWSPLDQGKIVKNFGRSVHKRFRTVSFQKGIEIRAAHKSPVYSVLPGTVEYEGWIKGLGNVVILHHGKGFYSLCGYLYKATVAKGDQVKKGEIVGYVGDTGANERPSLYFELRENNKAVDPIGYFPAKVLSKIS